MAWQQQAPQDQEWERLKERIRTRWPGLPEGEVDQTAGDRDALLTLMMTRLGYAPENAEHDLDEVLRGRRIVPRDVGDAEHHTGTAGPVPETGPVVRNFPGRQDEEEQAPSGHAAMPSRDNGGIAGFIGLAGEAFDDRTPLVAAATVAVVLIVGYLFIRRRRNRRRTLMSLLPASALVPKAYSMLHRTRDDVSEAVGRVARRAA